MDADSDSRMLSMVKGETFRRCVLGALLGGTLWAAIGFGLFGGWDWLNLWDVPVYGEQGFLVVLCVFAAISGVVGLVWGFLVAWPRRWAIGGGVGGGSVAVVVALLMMYIVWVAVIAVNVRFDRFRITA